MYKDIDELIKKAAEKINIPLSSDIIKLLEVLQSKGHDALIVGGAVRDAIMGFEPKDIDIEVYNIDYDSLQDFLSTYGKTDLVGKAFGVIKWRDSEGNDYDFSIPRRDSKVNDITNQKGRGISSEFDINITPEEAASRRDFTMNSLAYNPLSHQLYDFFGGVEDIENKVLRHTSPAFAEDPLRVLRGMQFSARFDLTLAPETAEMAKQLKDSKLVKERLSEEWMKLFTKGKKPSKGIQYLIDTEWIDNYPELKKLTETEQHPEHHPEGNVMNHIMLSADVAAEIADEEGLKGDNRASVLIAAITHDIGKPETTIVEDGKIKSPGHQSAGVPIAKQFLESIGIKNDIIKKVLPLVEYHMVHLDYKPKSKKTNVRQLSRKLSPATIQELERIMKADSLGRALTDNQLHQMAVQLIQDAKEEGVYDNPLDKILMGRDILEKYKFIKPGKELGEILAEVDMKYLRKEINTKEDALNYADKLLMNKYIFINGNELIALGIDQMQIKDIKNDIWEKQKNNEILSKQDAINYIKTNYMENKFSFSNIDELVKFANEKQLIIMRGLPGSGKSTTAKGLGGNIYASDDFIGKTKEEYIKNFNPETLHEAHNKNISGVEKGMQQGQSPIVVDNTNVSDFEMKPYVLLADKYGYNVSFKESEAPHWNLKENMSNEDREKLIQTLVEKNQHGVPEEAIRGKLDRWNFLDYNDKENIMNRIRNSKAPWEE
jgi:tRNA nucleotidyltransferase (CCA-adding enzyme)